MYKISHRQLFHPNSEPQMCHDLTLQIISYQIKDNMHNHGSIGILGSWILVGNLAFGCFSLFLFYFFLLFSLVWCGTSVNTKIWLVTKKVTASHIHRVLTKSWLLFLFCFWQFYTFFGPKNLFVFFFFLSFLFFFLLFYTFVLILGSIIFHS